MGPGRGRCGRFALVRAALVRPGRVVASPPIRAEKGGDAVGGDPEVAADAGDGFGERELGGVLRVGVEPCFEIAQQLLGVAEAAGFERGPDAAPDLLLAPGGGIPRGCGGLAGLRGLAPFLLRLAVFGEPGFQGHDLADGAGDAGELQRPVGGGVRWRPGRRLGRLAHRLPVQRPGEVHAELAEFGEHPQVALGALLRRVGGSRDRLGDGLGEIHEQNMN